VGENIIDIVQLVRRDEARQKQPLIAQQKSECCMHCGIHIIIITSISQLQQLLNITQPLPGVCCSVAIETNDNNGGR